jgi:hypothetical protein
MTWALSSGVRSSITKIAAAAVLIAIPTATVSIPAYAAPGFGGTPNTPAVLPAPPPADPPTDAPQPPPPPPPVQPSHGEYYNPNDPNDWWPYAGTGSF